MSRNTHWWLWSGILFVAFLFISLWIDPQSAVAGSSQEISALGQVQALAFHPDSYSLFLGTEHGLFVSPDEGKTWQKVSIQAPQRRSKGVLSLLICLASSGSMFVK